MAVGTATTFKDLYTKWVPLIAPVLLIVVQALISNGIIHLSGGMITVVDVILASLGLHSLHLRTK